jgi:hypothetical protein
VVGCGTTQLLVKAPLMPTVLWGGSRLLLLWLLLHLLLSLQGWWQEVCRLLLAPNHCTRAVGFWILKSIVYIFI